MTLSKTKKRKKRKADKKKNLSIIDPDFIKANQPWIPKSDQEFRYETNSWFDMLTTHKRTVDSKMRLSTEVTACLRSERIKLYPTHEQKIKLLDWLSVYRRLYNLTITHRSRFMNQGYMMSYIKMRDIIQQEFLLTSVNLNNEIHKTMLPHKDRIKNKIPLHSIWNAINDVNKAFTSSKANKDAGHIKSFRLRHKKLSNPKSTMVFEPSAFSSKINGFAVTALGEMKSSKPFGTVTHECRLSYNSDTGIFILWKPVDKVTKNIFFKKQLIALDPGTRTFQNGYSPNGICYKFGTDTTNIKIKNLFARIYNVVKTKNIVNETTNKVTKCNYKKFVKRIRKKITDMVTDMHWKTANYLCKNFDTVLIGNLSTTGIVKRNKSFFNASNKQYIISLSHYTFRERLLSKAKEYSTKCIVVDESYTTKTCGKCGVQNHKIGGAKIFKCQIESCKFKLDRDYNAGRNIFLKALAKNII